MTVEAIGIVAVLNFGILMLCLWRCNQFREATAELKEEKNKLKKAVFLDIKKERPTEGAHIIVWDSQEKRAIATLYKGTHEDWEKAKDKEGRFTHFLEVDPPV